MYHRFICSQFGLYSAGLEGLLGEEVDESEKDVEVTAGMSLDLVGVSLRPITFFTGQSGLMSAVWSAPSEPVSALQVMPISIFLFTFNIRRLFEEKHEKVVTATVACRFLPMSVIASVVQNAKYLQMSILIFLLCLILTLLGK